MLTLKSGNIFEILNEYEVSYDVLWRLILDHKKSANYIKIKAESSRIEDDRMLCIITQWKKSGIEYKLATYHSLVSEDVDTEFKNQNGEEFSKKIRCFKVNNVCNRKGTGEKSDVLPLHWFEISVNNKTLCYETVDTAKNTSEQYSFQKDKRLEIARKLALKIYKDLSFLKFNDFMEKYKETLHCCGIENPVLQTTAI